MYLAVLMLANQCSACGVKQTDAGRYVCLIWISEEWMRLTNKFGKIILTSVLLPHGQATRIILSCVERTFTVLLIFTSVPASFRHHRGISYIYTECVWTLLKGPVCRRKARGERNTSFSSMWYLSRGSRTNESHYSCPSHPIIACHYWLIFLFKHILFKRALQ